MSYFLVYGIDDDEKPVEGPHLASGGGWVAWSDWVLELDDFTECHCLAANGFSDNLPLLAEELNELVRAKGKQAVKAISRTLHKAITDKPANASCIVVTDGTEPGDDEDDDE